MKIITFYKQILQAAGLVVTSDDCVSINIAGESKPLTIAGQRLVLPTQAHLANPEWSDRVAFHPLSENTLLGESPVHERYRLCITTQINAVVSYLMTELIQLAVSPAEHKKLSPEQGEYLSLVKMADEKTLQALEKMLNNVATNKMSSTFVHIYQKRGGTVAGKKYVRGSIVSFPFYEELKASEKECMGVKLRVKDHEALLAMFSYIFPNCDKPEMYSSGSDSNIAPYLESLLLSVRNLAASVNNVTYLFSNILDEDKSIAAEWVPTLENLPGMLSDIRLIPSLKGNDGSLSKRQQEEGVATKAPEVPVIERPLPNTTLPVATPVLPTVAPATVPAVPLLPTPGVSSPTAGRTISLDQLVGPSQPMMRGNGLMGMPMMPNNPHAGRASPSNPAAMPMNQTAMMYGNQPPMGMVPAPVGYDPRGMMYQNQMGGGLPFGRI